MFRSTIQALNSIRKNQARKTALALAAAARPAVELLENRQLMSTSGIPMTDIFAASATPLGNLKLHSQHSAKGAVGGTAADDVYSVTVTNPVTLNVTVGGLQQSDAVGLFFPDGTEIDSISTSHATAKFSQPLADGTYYVEVSHGYTATAGAAAVRRTLSPTFGNFTLTLSATKSTTSNDPQNQQDFGAFDAAAGGGVQEPLINAQYTPTGAAYQDFSSDPLFASGGPSPDDIQQNACGDCYFLSTLSVIARNDPSLIEQDVQQTGSDQYQVTFQRNGQADVITVDGELPALNGSLVYAGLGTGNSIWVPIMEKAFTYFRNPQNVSYASIEGGGSDEVLADFGATSITTVSHNTMRNGAGLESQINSLFNAGDVVTLGTESQYTTSLVSGHAYSVVQVESNGQIELRNPWGSNPVNATNPDGPQLSDGGYITLSDTAIFNDTSVVWGAKPPQTVVPPPPATSGSVVATGTVFNDLNNDNTLDSGDPGIAGVTVYLTTTSGAPYQSSDPSGVTNSSGVYTINGLSAGVTYYVYELTPGGYTNDSPNGFYFTAAANMTYTSNFGNVQNAPVSGTQTISGVVFNDLNNDGNLDAGDPGIAGVTVYATTTSGAAFSANDLYAVTNSSGQYTINGVLTGVTYYIYEVAPAGWTISAHADGWHTNLAPGYNGINDDFGDIQTQMPASVSGVVFDDLNNDQTLDAGDPGIGGVTVYATTIDHGAYSSGDLQAVTSSNGSYTITGLTPGVTYYIYEVTPNGWVNSNGNGAGWYDTLASGEHDTGLNFANMQTPAPITSNLATLNGDLGANSIILRNDSMIDAYVTSANTSAYTTIAVGAGQGFDPVVEVLEFNSYGFQTNSWINSNAANNSTATLSFQTQAGDTYEIVIGSRSGATGGYTLGYFSDVLVPPQQLSPN